MAGINEELKECKSCIEKEFSVIELFRKNSTVIGDKKILEDLSRSVLEDAGHMLEMSKIVSDIQSSVAKDVFSMKDIIDDVETPLDKPALAELLAEFLKEEKGQQLVYKETLKTIKSEDMRKRIERLKNDEIEHEKIVRELMDYLG